MKQQKETIQCINISHDKVKESQTLTSWLIKYIKKKSIKCVILPEQVIYINTITGI